jgi:putative DNA primase/helicase
MRPTWSFILSCNNKPTITGVDKGIWRRIRIIPWGVDVDPAVQREQIEVVNDLLSEASGILNWLLQGWADAKVNKKWVAEEVMVETQEYRERQDITGDFIESCCVLGDGFTAKVGDLYDAYCKWCEEEKETPVSKKMFGMKMDSKGFKQIRDGHTGIRRWAGIGLKWV